MTYLQKTMIKNRLSDTEITNKYGTPENVISLDIPDLELENIEKLKDIKKASEVLINNLDSLIVLSVDIDCDGITSGYIGYRILKDMMCVNDVEVVIGTRSAGRGVNALVTNKIMKNVVKRDIKKKVLLITADHGTNDNNSYKELRNLVKDIDIIVTDHHVVDTPTDGIDVLVNNMQEGSCYHNSLCGSGTLFILLYYTLVKYYKKSILDLEEYLPYVATSTLSDRVSLKSPLNRYFVNKGLEVINSNPDINFKLLKQTLKITGKVTYADITFTIAPFINTANRTSVEEVMLGCLICDIEEKKKVLLEYLDDMNTSRKKEVRRVIGELSLDRNMKSTQNSVVIEIDSNYMVSGIVASNLNETLDKPAVCVSRVQNKYIGSCRSNDFNILGTINQLKNDHPGIVLHCAGHHSACGVEISGDRLEDFRLLLDKYVNVESKILSLYEFHITHDDINMDLYKEIEVLSPFGQDWPEVTFTTEPVTVVSSFSNDYWSFFRIRLDNGNLLDCMSRVAKRLYPEIPYVITFSLRFNSNSKREWLSLRVHNIEDVNEEFDTHIDD